MRTLALAVVVSAALVGTASAAPQRDALIRPGVGIGKVRLGMTFAQARRALGRPEGVQRQRRFGFGSRYAEYTWGLTDWIVAVTGRGDRARVVMVATGLRRERTRSRVGVGSTDGALRRALGARCLGRNTGHDPYVGKDTMTCFLGRSQRAPHTVFSLVESCLEVVPPHSNCPPRKVSYRVYEVRVGEPRFIWGYWGP